MTTKERTSPEIALKMGDAHNDTGQDVVPVPSGPDEEKAINETVKRLLESFQRYNPNEDTDALVRAIAFAMHTHQKQRRETGEPYILHPLQVSQILTGIEMDSPTIIAGVLHDTVEDGKTVTVDHIREGFGAEVAELVNGVTKLKKTGLKQKKKGSGVEGAEPGDPPEGKRRAFAARQKQSENLRKILLAVARDFRVMIIKLADRLHNMETLGVKPEEDQQRIALETLQIYAPLAHRLGVGHIKWQLEDLSFKYLYPEEFKALAEKVAATRKTRESEIEELREILSARLAEAGLYPVIQGRPKHLYSIFTKMKTQELDFDQIYDLIAMRIIADTEPECYTALGVVHNIWLPVRGMFTDYIAMPKPNMYQSLHTKVMGPRNAVLEIQIRTKEMHRTADFGVAAHWQYKEGGSAKADFDSRMAWMSQQLFSWSDDNKDESEFLRNVVDNLFADQVFVFTPEGDVIDMVAGATIVDFAYRVHTELGDRCVGGRINGKIAAINSTLSNGDIVEVIARRGTKPSLDWLSFVKTSHAKTKIRQFHRREHYAENVQRGREMLEREAQRLGVELHGDRNEHLEQVARAMNYTAADDLLAAIGHGQAAAQTVVNRLRDVAPVSDDRIVVSRAPTGALEIRAGELDESMITRAKCCSPLPGEDVVGYVTQGRGVALHSRACRNFAALAERSPERVTEVSWGKSSGTRVPVPIRIEAFDRVGLLQDISSVFSAGNINIHEANIKRRDNHISVLELKPEVESVEQLEVVLANVRKLSDVIDIYRITSAGADGAREVTPEGAPDQRPPS